MRSSAASRAGGPLRDDESAVAWFYRLLRNVIVDHLRRESAEARGSRRAAPASESVDRGRRARPGAGRHHLRLRRRSLVGTLRPDYAAAIQRVDLGGESLQSFATAAGITRGNAAVRLFRARQALRRRIEQSCGTCATHGCYQCECAPRPTVPRSRR